MGGSKKGERGKGDPRNDKFVDEIAFPTSPAVRGDECLLSTGQPRMGLQAIPDPHVAIKLQVTTSMITSCHLSTG